MLDVILLNALKLIIILLNVILLGVIMLDAILLSKLNVILLSVLILNSLLLNAILLNVNLLGVDILSVVMLNGVTPFMNVIELFLLKKPNAFYGSFSRGKLKARNLCHKIFYSCKLIMYRSKRECLSLSVTFTLV
jgi:hypothetical protein